MCIRDSQEGTINTSCSGIDDNFQNCDYIFLCAPISYNNAYLCQLKDVITPGCILTDVGSVKTSIHEEIARLGMEDCFIGGHPMSGSEKTGFVNSKALLLENAYYVMTPTESVPKEKVEEYRELITLIHAIPLILDLSLIHI